MGQAQQLKPFFMGGGLFGPRVSVFFFQKLGPLVRLGPSCQVSTVGPNCQTPVVAPSCQVHIFRSKIPVTI